ncbi:MAG: hypothetical protein H6506_02245 [Calditrichaeota bacterium]|nr:hypothetical protein [Calditrichota bacterium]MCB9367062.1 hypothetical protein [Calditrichota bacterium]MCB9391454.1 hypothetical protein [Calditrichota bacterium]
MKRVLLILLAVVPILASGETTRSELAAKLDSYLKSSFGATRTSPLSSGVLYDLVVPLFGIDRVNGSSGVEAVSHDNWKQIAFELRNATLAESPIPGYRELQELRHAAQQSGRHPLSLLLFDYQQVEDQTRRNELIEYQDGSVRGVNESLLTTKRVAALSVLHDWTYRGSDVEFTIDPATKLYSNLEAPSKIEVDLADGLGFREVTHAASIRASYSEVGEKIITARITLPGGSVLFSRAKFEVRSLDAPPPDQTWALTASHSFSGTPATGEAYILLAPGHSLLTKPVVLVEGLDLTNSLNWDELYDLMNQEMLIETLRSIGFDAVVLNYGNSQVHVQDNAFLVQELIEEINSATGGLEPVVMVGTSLGGITTRYALTYMEANSLPHNVSLFISVDSPQNGANIPIGIQYWADFFADQAAEAAEARDALLTPAPRQLLLYHLSSSGSGTAHPDPMFAALQNDFVALGDYPSQPRLVSVINGSSTQQNSGFLPGAQIISWVYNSLLVDIRGNVWAVSNTANTRVLQGEINLIWPLPDEFRDVYIAPCLPWDNAPGGLTATMEELAAVPAPYGDIVALHPSHCFIPSVSALDLSVSDPFFDIAGAQNLYDLSPFDSLYFPVANQDHVQITPENAEWFINEIVGPLSPPLLTIVAEGDSVRLNWTPVFGANVYDIYSATEHGQWTVPLYSTSQTTVAFASNQPMEFFQVTPRRN